MGGDGEFAFIERLAARLPARPAGQVGVGDDCAVLESNRLIATDLLVEGVHFRSAWASPADIGWKALAVNLSDIAAMGGTPESAVVAVALPPTGPVWPTSSWPACSSAPTASPARWSAATPRPARSCSSR